MKLKTEFFILIAILLDSILKIYFESNFHVFFKFLPFFFIILWFFQNKVGHFRKSDYLVLVSLVFTLSGEILFLFRDSEIIVLIILICYIIEHQIYISLLRISKVNNNLIKNEVIIKKGWPYLLIGFLFFGILLKNSVPDVHYILVIFYVFQISILGAFSLILNKTNKGRKLIIYGVGLMVLSDAFSSYVMFVSPFPYDYFFIRISFVFSKVILMKGYINSFIKIDAN